MKMFRLLTPLLLLIASAFGTTTVSSPTSGATVPNPIHFVASNPSAHHMSIYVDYTKVYDVDASKIDTTLFVVVGPHKVTIQSWDTDGTVEKAAISITAVQPLFAESFLSMEETAWSSCGTCGNSQGNTKPAYGSQQSVQTPALAAPAAQFSISGQYAYTNFYWYLKAYGTYKFKNLAIDYDIYMPGAYVNAPQALECEVQQRYQNYLYDYAIQADYVTNTWRTFDKVTRVWTPTDIPLVRYSADAWHHVRFEFAPDYVTHNQTLVAITVDGVKSTPTKNMTHAALYQSGSDYLTRASFQEDMNKFGTNFYVFLDNYSLLYNLQ